MKKYFSRKTKQNRRISKTARRNKKTRRNKKGGLLFNQNLNIGGIDMSKNTGEKRYNWQTGKWDDVVCYGIGPLKGCKIVPAK
jgi:hypothetical protein